MSAFADNVDTQSLSDVRAHPPVIGEIIRLRRQLTDEDVDEILHHQRVHGLRFGEAAVALRLASKRDVLGALSQQFKYPYPPGPEPTDGALNPELVVASSPFSDEAEAFRELRSQVMTTLSAPGSAGHVLAVLSPDVGDGKSFIAANLATAFSQLRARTLLIDADMRTPRLHQMFGLGQTLGLSHVLAGRGSSSSIVRVPGLPKLFVLPVGAVPPNPLELLERRSFGMLMDWVRARFEYIVLDTPAAIHGADSRVVAAQGGAALVVGRRDKTRMQAMSSLLAGLSRSQARLAGVVLNDW
jgi:chain length determinant protein tyrosine kinase EpsG